MTWRVMISAPYILPFPEKYRQILEAQNIEIIEMSVVERLSESDLLNCIENFDGAICGDDQFTENVFKKAKRLKVVSKWGTGTDSIDKLAAAKFGVKVCNTPNAFNDAVADTTLGYILNFARRLCQMNAEIRKGLWKKPSAVSLRETSLGIVGIGNIGRAVALRAKAFGMKIFGNDVIVPSESFLAESGMIFTDLKNLLVEADFVTLHCDLNAGSYHLIGKTELAFMKPTAFLINTSRGSVIDEDALIQTLRENKIAGAALDVFEIEPLPAKSVLRDFENCLFAPHNSNNSPSAREFVHESTVANLLRGLQAANLSSEEYI